MVCYVMSQNGGLPAIGRSYTLGKMLNLGLTDICKPYVYLAKMEIPPVLLQMSSIIGLWVRSAVVPVLTLFCALIFVSSLLAEELDNKTKENEFPTEREAMSLALDDWLIEFDQLYKLIEIIKDFFKPILAITIFYFFIQFPCSVYNLILNAFINSAPWSVLKQNMWFICMLTLRFCTIAIVCQQLRDKVGR